MTFKKHKINKINKNKLFINNKTDMLYQRI